jgi:hypothetical protein
VSGNRGSALAVAAPSPGRAAPAVPLPVVAAVDMGYGHLRAAVALADAAGTTVLEADRPPVAGPVEAAFWRIARGGYGLLSRATGWPVAGPAFLRLLDAMTAIPRGGEGVDRSAPDGAARLLLRLGRAGLGSGLLRHVPEDAPLVATFYAQALLAEAAGRPRVICVATDSDIHRVWAPADASASRIVYCVPCRGTARRLRAYGVPAERIRVTGFPLPPERLGGRDLGILRVEAAARIARLDPSGRFREREGAAVERRLGVALPAAPPGPLVAAYCVGGSGAQTGAIARALPSYREAVSRGEVRLVLVAGSRVGVARRFREGIRAAGLREGEGVEVLLEPDAASYFRRVHGALGGIDVLWTKPSEMTFFAALGIPLVLAPPLGGHERRNRRRALRAGVGDDQVAPGDQVRRLLDERESGALARRSWNGLRRLIPDGTYRILDEVARLPRAGAAAGRDGGPPTFTES